MKKTLADQQRTDENNALRAYARICKRTDRPEDGDSKELVQILQLLNLTTDDFDGDVAAYQGIGEMTARADEYEALRNIAIEAGKRVQTQKREAEDADKRMELERRELTTAHLTACHQSMNAKVKVEQLQRTRDRHPRVFSPPPKLVAQSTARALSRSQAATQKAKREAKRDASVEKAAAAAQQVAVATDDE